MKTKTFPIRIPTDALDALHSAGIDFSARYLLGKKMKCRKHKWEPGQKQEWYLSVSPDPQLNGWNLTENCFERIPYKPTKHKRKSYAKTIKKST